MTNAEELPGADMCNDSRSPEVDLAERRTTFDKNFIEPLVIEAKTIGIPMTGILARIIEIETQGVAQHHDDPNPSAGGGGAPPTPPPTSSPG
jgi:hypothetical protein